TADQALVTAISNDRDFAKVFADQLRVLARPDDMALAISTSGQSPNLVQALAVGREQGLLTIAFTGKDGGRLADLAEYCFVVPSFSIHRIQETHVALYHIVWDLVHVVLGGEDVISRGLVPVRPELPDSLRGHGPDPARPRQRWHDDR